MMKILNYDAPEELVIKVLEQAIPDFILEVIRKQEAAFYHGDEFYLQMLCPLQRYEQGEVEERRSTERSLEIFTPISFDQGLNPTLIQKFTRASYRNIVSLLHTIPVYLREKNKRDDDCDRLGIYNLDKNGDLKVENLPMGIYELQEIKTLDGLVLDTTKYEVKFTQKDQVTKVYTETKRLSNNTTIIEISKTDITGEKQLIGAKLTVVDEDGNIIDSWVSNEENHKIEGLTVGKTYILREEIAPEGYTIAEDDNDGILETVSKSGTTWTWDVSIASDTITDGVYDIVVVAFDAAGNCAKTETTTMISNNMPRLSKVYLATDLNFNGAYSDDEYGISRVDAAGEEQVEYGYSALTNGVSTQVVELDTTYQYLDSASKEQKEGTFAVKKDLRVVTEFVSGGNTAIYALPKLFAETTSESYRKANKGTNGDVNSVNSAAKMNTFEPSANIGGTNSKEYTLTSESIPGLSGYTAEMENSSSTSKKSYLQLTLWDTVNITDESTVATEDVMDGDLIETYGNQYTILNIPFIMDIEDDVNPTSNIDDLTENSVYTVTKKDAVTGKDVTEILGHIEPSGTLSTSIFNGTGLFDKDDKVSGQIVYTGKVTDNTYINTLSVTATGTNATLFTDTQVATYTNGQLEFDSDYGPDNYATKGLKNGWYIQKEKETFTQATGHTVEWKLVVDTSTVKNGETKVYAAKDVTFTVDVTDGNETALTGTDSNRMDIVPYITGILRTSTTNSNIERTHRSTYGEYPVAIGDTLTVTGYNLSTGPTVKVGTTPVDHKDPTGTEFKIDVPTNSGELVVTVNGDVETLNHKNNNSLKTNRDTSDEKLYDNCYLRVWDVDHYFSGSMDRNEPTMVADTTGNLFSSWTIMGSAQVQMQKNLKGTTKAVWISYDQPDLQTHIAVDTKQSNNLSLIFSSPHVGSSGKGISNGYADLNVMGGMIGTGIPNNFGNINATATAVSIANNPYTKMDGTTSPGYQLASYAMRRDVSQYTYGKSARFNNDLHFAYYDKKNKALRYTYQNMSTDRTSWQREQRCMQLLPSRVLYDEKCCGTIIENGMV